MKILTVRTGQRKFGRVANLFAKKLDFGLIRLGHYIYTFDDREIARSQSLFSSRFGGTNKTNKRFLEVCDNFRPAIIFLGHADIISNKALIEARRLIPNVRIAHWNVDAFFVPRNYKRFERFAKVSDAVFATTGGKVLADFKSPNNQVAYIPNAVDSSIERFLNDEKSQFDCDLMFCGSTNIADQRNNLIMKLLSEKRLDTVRFDVRGLGGKPQVFGDKYDQVLSNSKMSINLSKQNDFSLYSSSRIAQIMGNGILTFIPAKTGLNEIIHEDEAVFYSDYDDLIEKILYFNQNDEERRKIAKNGRIASHQSFSSERVAKFMIELTTGSTFSEKYEWLNHVL